MPTSVWRLAESILSPSVVTIESKERQEERAWLDRCAEGDEQAVRLILSRYRDRAIRLAACILQNTNEAIDAAQEAFVIALRQLDPDDGDLSFKARLYRVLIQLCMDRTRRKRVRAGRLQETGPMPVMAALSAEMEKRRAVEQVLNSLPLPMRAVLVLREVEGLECAEIAVVLNIPVWTVRSRLNTAREQFRRRSMAIQPPVKATEV